MPTSGDYAAIRGATRRGFTFHEELDNIGLIHMNGRVYDPNVGRFLSVDPVMGDLTDTQSINPYAYVGNRPLSFTDPTGLQAPFGCGVWQLVCDIVWDTAMAYLFREEASLLTALPGLSGQGPLTPCSIGTMSTACEAPQVPCDWGSCAQKVPGVPPHVILSLNDPDAPEYPDWYFSVWPGPLGYESPNHIDVAATLSYFVDRANALAPSVLAARSLAPASTLEGSPAQAQKPTERSYRPAPNEALSDIAGFIVPVGPVGDLLANFGPKSWGGYGTNPLTGEEVSPLEQQNALPRLVLSIGGPIGKMVGPTAKVGAKSFEQMNRHLDKLRGARQMLSDMESRLENIRGKKAMEALKDAIQDLRDQIKGHEKEIRQKWPELGTDF